MSQTNAPQESIDAVEEILSRMDQPALFCQRLYETTFATTHRLPAIYLYGESPGSRSVLTAALMRFFGSDITTLHSDAVNAFRDKFSREDYIGKRYLFLHELQKDMLKPKEMRSWLLDDKLTIFQKYKKPITIDNNLVIIMQHEKPPLLHKHKDLEKCILPIKIAQYKGEYKHNIISIVEKGIPRIFELGYHFSNILNTYSELNGLLERHIKNSTKKSEPC